MSSGHSQCLDPTKYLSTAFVETSPLQMVFEEEEGGGVLPLDSENSQLPKRRHKRVFVNPGPRHTQPAKPGYLQVSLVEWPQSPATSESLARHHGRQGRQTVYYGSDTHPEGVTILRAPR